MTAGTRGPIASPPGPRPADGSIQGEERHVPTAPNPLRGIAHDPAVLARLKKETHAPDSPTGDGGGPPVITPVTAPGQEQCVVVRPADNRTRCSTTSRCWPGVDGPPGRRRACAVRSTRGQWLRHEPLRTAFVQRATTNSFRAARRRGRSARSTVHDISARPGIRSRSRPPRTCWSARRFRATVSTWPPGPLWRCVVIRLGAAGNTWLALGDPPHRHRRLLPAGPLQREASSTPTRATVAGRPPAFPPLRFHLPATFSQPGQT